MLTNEKVNKFSIPVLELKIIEHTVELKNLQAVGSTRNAWYERKQNDLRLLKYELRTRNEG